ncbi:MAG: pitrilysin family protein [Rhodanobacteraceae bacterium]
MHKFIVAAIAAFFIVLDPCGAAAATLDGIDIPVTRFTLPNGLTVVVSEDHKAPVVAVSVWYHVGSADEPPGKTGFAHLFEHLMFQGSENHKDEYFRPFELAGATDQNGTTSYDRTNYYETVPTTALDMALWMESDRMGHLLGAIGQAQLDEQRGVVQNEKREDENQPYGRADEVIQRNAFPANHPYHHETVGSMADLNAASLADVKQWFRQYYGAANATIALVGDITPVIARQKMLEYFGDIPPGPPVARLQPWVAPRNTSSATTTHDEVAQARIYREWNVPQLGAVDEIPLELAAAVLGRGKTSRLYQRLVYQDHLADNVSVDVDALELASLFTLQVDVKGGVDPKTVEAAIDQEWQRFVANGPTEDELARVKTDTRADFVRSIERVNGKASLLASGQVYRDDPDAWKTDLERVAAATPADVTQAARRWITKGDFTLTVLPAIHVATTKSASLPPLAGKGAEGGTGQAPKKPMDVLRTPSPSSLASDAESGRPAVAGRPPAKMPLPNAYHAVASSIDRSNGVPPVSTFPALVFPKLQHGKLANGIEIVLAERHTIPLVDVQLLFDAGYASDAGRKLGTSAFTMAMLDEGTTDLDSLEIARRSERLGANIGAGSGLDYSTVELGALASNLTPSLALLADIVRHPAFRADDFARIRGQWLARIAQEKTEPTGLALRVLPPLLYGTGHPYAIPFTGSGTAASIESLDAHDLRNWMRDFIRPDNVRILVAGDTTLDAITARLNAIFGDWKAPSSAIPKEAIAHVGVPERPRVYLMDKPGAPQSLILAGEVAPSTKAANNVAIEIMNGAFGGSFTSRLNMDLREGKHWAYGAGSFLPNAIGQRPFMVYAPVQTDKTAPSIAEIIAQTHAVIGTKPLSAAEIDKIKVGQVRSLPGKYQTVGSVLGAMAGIELYARPDDYVQTLKSRIDATGNASIQAAAKEIIQPGALTWVIVGDLSKIEQPVRALKLGAVHVLDLDGKVVR